MSAISEGIKGYVKTSVALLNTPTIKEGVKNVLGSVTFAFGLLEMYDLYQILQGRSISTETHSSPPTLWETANKVVILSAKISLILSAGVSRPGVFLISSLVGTIFSTTQLARVFGPNTIFAVNPWHPRHVVSIVAVILALPSNVQAVYKCAQWAFKSSSAVDKRAKSWLTDTKVRMMTLWNTITSRPALHVGNSLSRLILRSA